MEVPTYDYEFYIKRGFRILRKNYVRNHIEFLLNVDANGCHWGRFEICSSDNTMDIRFQELLEHTKTLQDTPLNK